MDMNHQQMISYVGESGIAPESALLPPTENPSFNFMPGVAFSRIGSAIHKEIHLADKIVKDEDEDEQVHETSKKKRCYRHTSHQIQEMEMFFKECPHPDDKQRKKLSQDLGLHPSQVKFWFQNRRTQKKAERKRVENQMLSTKNRELQTENCMLQAAIGSILCSNCGGPNTFTHISADLLQLQIENVRLKDELERVRMFLVSCNINEAIHPMHQPSPSLPSPNDSDQRMSVSSPSRQFKVDPDMLMVMAAPNVVTMNSMMPTRPSCLHDDSKTAH